MRILHINRNYLGTALHQTMIEHLDNLGVDSQVFVPVCSRDAVIIKPNNNVVVSNCFYNIDRYVYDLKQFKIIRAIEKNIDVKSFDVIHAYTLFTDGNAAMKLAEKYRKPFVVAIRDTDVNDFFAKMFYLRGRGVKIMRKAQKIFFLSEAYRKQVFEQYVPQRFRDELFAKTMIVPNGIDDFWIENQWNEQKKLGSTLKLLFVGKICRRKNVSIIKKAMDILDNKGIKTSLTVVGNIAEQQEYEKIKNDKRISCLSAMTKEKLIAQYRSHDVFVMPSFTETFGLVYAEALTQGLPVVYTKGQGFDEQFKEGTVGFSVDCTNPENIADSIELILADYEKIRRNCVCLCDRFDWKSITRLYNEIYHGFLSSTID